MKKQIVYLGLMSLFLFYSCGFSVGGGGRGSSKKRANTKYKIYFEQAKYEKVLSLATEEQKPIFLDFYTDWCAPCRWLEKDAFENESAARYFNKNLVSLKINAEKGEGVELAQQFKVRAFPTLIYLKPNGQEISRHVGLTSANHIISMAKKSVKVIDDINKAKK